MATKVLIYKSERTTTGLEYGVVTPFGVKPYSTKELAIAGAAAPAYFQQILRGDWTESEMRQVIKVAGSQVVGSFMVEAER